MPPIMDEKTKEELKALLSGLSSPLKILYFTQQIPCPTCGQQEEILRELASLSDKIELNIYDFVLNRDEALRLRVDKIPATVVIGKRDYGIKFYGLTSGYEFSSLLEAIIMVSSGKSNIEPELESLISRIKEPVHLQVFVTLTCPYCPKMVHLAHQFAFLNENIRADMVEAAEFPQLANKYHVTTVPRTIVNEIGWFEGALPATQVYLEILKTINPEEFRRIDEAMREAGGTRKTKNVDEGHVYEAIVVGGGPAAMSASVYAARKGMDVAVVAKKLGGQLTYTSRIENYLGLEGLSGSEMTETFRNHFESYPIAEALGVGVIRVEKKGELFRTHMDDGRLLSAMSVIYCAGKEYLRLGVPGEDRFIGKGIAFCATCDAPLYAGRRVAVVGGGNSAFTAARDLMQFASEIHVIHRRDEFKADESLVQEVRSSPKAKFHTSMEIRSFLGTERLTGVRLESVDGKDRYDLNVDGVFLEIGLTPNTMALKDLVRLNELGEVPVMVDQSTDVVGLFAAGDVTDVKEKQIAVAVGQGAMAALTAYRYLVKTGKIKTRSAVKDQWD